MSTSGQSDQVLIEQIRAGDRDAWSALIARFEGRLQAFAASRLGRRTASEDVVQETFIGFITSLPNFDAGRSLETWLFSICAHKLTDHLRREGRRPALPLSSDADSRDERDLAGSARAASSIVRSGERRHLEADALAKALGDIIDGWRKQRQWDKICCAELLLVRGTSNKQVAARLKLTEQQVANWKHELITRLTRAVRTQGLSDEVFPELNESG